MQDRRRAQEVRGAPGLTLHYSTMRRAAETAALIAQRQPETRAHPTPDLWEIPAVSVPAHFAHWFARFTPAQIEAGRAQAERAYQRFFKPARGQDRHSLIVCHGNVIRYFLSRAFELGAETWLHFDTYNAGLTQVVIERDGRLRLVTFNDAGHLPAQWRTFI